MVQCRICGLIYISPRPKSERLSAYYPSSANAYIGRTRGRFKQAAWNAARTLGLDLFDIGLNMSKGNSLLDVGCGYGDLLIYYKSRGVNCVGVDFSELATAKAREYGLDVRHGSLFDQKFRDNSFDALIMCHSLEHITFPGQVIAEIRRILKPGGIVQIAVPNGGSSHFGPLWQHISFPLHLYHFTANTLMRCFEGSSGFSEVSVITRKRTDALRLTATRL